MPKLEELTWERLENAPSLVQFIWACSINKRPIGMSLYDEAIEKHPEYFPEEVEHRRKWDLIPEEVHEAYRKEYWEMVNEIEKDLPEKTGLMGAVFNDEYHKEWSKLQPLIREKEKEIHNKHYKKYGI